MGRPSTAKKRLIRAASIQFARSGAQAVGVDELCRLASANKGSFYHFFPSKNDLILACLEEAWERLRAEVLEPAFAPGRSPHERVALYFDLQIEQQKRHREICGIYSGCVFGTLGNELSVLDPAIRKHVAQFSDRMIAFLRGALNEAAENQLFFGDSREVAAAIHVLMTGALMQVRLRQQLAPLQCASRAARVILECFVGNKGITGASTGFL